MELHTGYYAGAEQGGPAWSPTRSTSEVLSGLRGKLLEGLTLTLTLTLTLILTLTLTLTC